jgi:toxin CptA
MHNAPSVSYPVGRSRFALGILLAAWLAGFVGILLWLAQSQQHRPQAVLAFVLALGSGVWAAASWLRSASGRLVWTGSAWTWCCGSEDADGGVDVEVSPEVILDVQHSLLLRLQPEPGDRSSARVVWAWLDRGPHLSRWHDLRRAVYSRAKPDALPGTAGPRAAKQ